MSEKRLPSLDSFDEWRRPYVAGLRSDDPAVRADALEEIAIAVDAAIARELLGLARDPERGEEERGRAVTALGPALEQCYLEEAPDGSLEPPPPGTEEWWGEPPFSSTEYGEVLEELRRLHEDDSLPKLVRRRAFEAAVRAPRDWQRKAVLSAWRSDDPEWRLTAVFAMGYLHGFEDEIREAFEGDDPALRREAMLTAGHGPSGEILADELLPVAADPEAPQQDRLIAIDRVAELHPDGAFEILDELTADLDAVVADAAEEALEEVTFWLGLDEFLDSGDR